MFQKINLLIAGLVVFLCLGFVNNINAYIGEGAVEDIENESSEIWDLSNTGWTFKTGVVSVCFDSGKVRIEFVYSEGNKNFYEQTFSNGERKPLGFEIELKDLSGTLLSSKLYPSKDNIPDDAQYEDTSLGDSGKSLTVAISDPTKLSENELYWAEFDCSELTSKNAITFSLQVQLTGDLNKLRNSYESLYEEYSNTVNLWANRWLNNFDISNSANCFFVLFQPDERIYETFESEGINLINWIGLDEEDKHRHSYSCEIFPVLDIYGGNTSVNQEIGIDVLGIKTEYNSINSNSYIPISTPPSETITVPPDPGDDDVHIVYEKVRHYKEGSFIEEIQETLNPGDVRYYETEGKVENDGNTDLENVDIDHRVDASKNRFDRNDTNMGDDKEDIDEGDTEISHSPRITLTVAQDGQSVYVIGDGGGEHFPVINGFVTLYFFLDVDAEGDNDLSDPHTREEYAKLEITIISPQPPVDSNIPSDQNLPAPEDSNSLAVEDEAQELKDQYSDKLHDSMPAVMMIINNCILN